MTYTPPATVTMTVTDRIAHLTIDNPRQAGALTRPMLRELRGHLDAIAHTPGVRAVVLTGTGHTFSVGLDISAITVGEESIEHDFVDVEGALARCPKPTIAAIAGHCIGGGTQLAVACDLRIAADTARFALTPATLGLVYPADSIERLTAVIGPAATKRLLLTADTITADTALTYGLVTDVLPAAELAHATATLAATIAARSPVTVTAAKQMTDTAARGEVPGTLRRHWRITPNPDLPVGLAAFAAKTTPTFPTHTPVTRPERTPTSMLLTALDPTRLATDTATAITIGADHLSREELHAAASALAATLPGPGPVAVHATATMDTVVAVTAAILAGIPVVPIAPDSGPAELRHILADAAVTHWVGDPHPASTLPTVPVSRRARTVGNLGRGPSADDIAMIVYTSGTTGAPKGVNLSHRALAAGLDALAEAWQWTADDTVVHGLPLFHLHGLVLGTLGSLRVGSRVVHTGNPKPGSYAAADGTMYFGVPTVWSRIVADETSARALSRARLLVSGSAPLPTPVFEQITALTGHAPLERYGMSETMITLSTRADGERRPGWVGAPLRGVQTRLIGEDGLEVPADGESIGRLQVRGPMLFDGYLNRPDATAAAWTDDGWFVTGDLAAHDASGFHRIVGRESVDLIKSGGYRIGAGEIETALLAHPSVREVAVVGQPDPDLGQRVVAFVVTDEHHLPGHGAALTAFVADTLSHHKRPREVVFVDALPRNAMGKVQKKLLVS